MRDCPFVGGGTADELKSSFKKKKEAKAKGWDREAASDQDFLQFLQICLIQSCDTSALKMVDTISLLQRSLLTSKDSSA